MKRTYIAFTTLILIEIFLVCLGCHGGGNPTLPGSGYEGDPSANLASGSGGAAVMPSVWGLYQVTYNPSTHVIEQVPLRSPQLTWNVVHFLQPPAGSANNLMVSVLDDSSFLTDGRMDIRVIIHHPFPGQATYTGFDVMGVFITNGSKTSEGDSHLNYAADGIDPVLLNPDGYTRWMNPREFLTGNVFGFEHGIFGTSESSENSGFLAGATINPYKYYAQGLGPHDSLYDWVKSPTHDAGRGMFPSGATCSRDYELKFPIVGGKLVFVFDYAVLANWVAPAVDPPSDPVVDFPVEANAEYPLHVFATDRSRVYHTASEAGGTLSFDLEIFDWDVPLKHETIPEQISGFRVWSDDPLVPGGYVDVLSEEVEWNSGFTASLSIASVDIPGAVPAADGDTHVWISVESSKPSSYDQGLGSDAPDVPVAMYVRVPVNVKSCPRAFMNDLETKMGGVGEKVANVLVHGTNFNDGDQLGVYLALEEANGGSGDSDTKIEGTNVKYIDDKTLSVDFDLSGAKMGHYGVGCRNGCGLETLPDENKGMTGVGNFDVVMPAPLGVHLSTDRTGPLAEATSKVDFTWNPVEGADSYNVYAKSYTLTGDPAYNCMIKGIKTTQHIFTLSTFQIAGGGTIELWATSNAPTTDNSKFESKPSSVARVYYQGFEAGMGDWMFANEGSSLQFVRASSYAPFTGTWGVKSYGYFPSGSPVWAAILSPPIDLLKGAKNVNFEFVHRHKALLPTCGYQVGWCTEVPPAGSAKFTGYHPITSAAYGKEYNNAHSAALQSEFSLTSTNDANFSSNLTGYWGWYLSGFDASAILGNTNPARLVIGLAGDSYSCFELNIDEAVILVY